MRLPARSLVRGGSSAKQRSLQPIPTKIAYTDPLILARAHDPGRIKLDVEYPSRMRFEIPQLVSRLQIPQFDSLIVPPARDQLAIRFEIDRADQLEVRFERERVAPVAGGRHVPYTDRLVVRSAHDRTSIECDARQSAIVREDPDRLTRFEGPEMDRSVPGGGHRLAGLDRASVDGAEVFGVYARGREGGARPDSHVGVFAATYDPGLVECQVEDTRRVALQFAKDARGVGIG